MSAPEVAILTEARYERPPDPDDYTRRVLLEDDLLRDALQRHGLCVQRLDWARADVTWSQFDAAIFRSTWDYFLQPRRFERWLAQAAGRTRLINDVSLVRWNMDKRYLLDLAARGIEVVPTHVVPRGVDATLADLLDRAGLDQAVVKPAVSGAGRDTHRVARSGAAAFEKTFRELVAREDMLVQPFEASIMDQGELSLVVIGGRCTHAVRKRAGPGEFRVQDDHGGSVELHVPAPGELAFAEAAAGACDPLPLYARVDVVRRAGGDLALMELELIEPELFFRLEPSAADAMAKEIAEEVTEGRSG